MSVTTNLVVPVVLWGNLAPTHCISCIYLSRDQKTLVTGCYDGQLCLWEVDPESLKMTPRCLLVGHTGPVLCITRASAALDNSFIVSSSESGEMCTWDLVDGRCLEAAKLSYVHTNIQSYHMTGSEDVWLFCNGYYAEILIINPFSLEIVFTLASKVNPDWISAMHVLRPARRQDDVVLALTTTGTVKVWTLSGQESKSQDPIYENESKQIRCLNALTMICCAYNQRTVLIVCSKFWQIYDAGDFSLLCSVMSPRGERWLGGDFVTANIVHIWSDEGKGYIYQLPTNCIVESKDFHNKQMEGNNPFLYFVLMVAAEKPLSCPPAVRYHIVSKGGQLKKYLLRGDSEGKVVVWNIPEITENHLQQIMQEETKKPQELSPIVSISLQQAWDEMRPSPVGILDQMDTAHLLAPKLSASIYLPIQGRLVCGREDGSIIIVPATQTVMLQLLHGKHQQYDDWPPHQIMMGHTGRVNCLLYPHHIHSRYEMSHLVSGGIDFSVCLWDLYAGTLLHRFSVHAGEITQLLVPPASCSPRIQQCVCSVASDHSVTLLSLKERKCVMLASRHLFPVTTIKWRPMDDFMVVGCADGTVYVWQIDTGHLDRVVHGMNAEEVLNACDEHYATESVAEGGMANPAVHFFRGLRHRNLAAIRHAAQRGLHQLQQQQHMASHDSSEQKRAYPLMIQGLRTNPKDAESHVLFFDIEALIVQLLSEEYSTMSPNTLEAQGLINQSEYQKVAALTRSASPDAQKKIVGYMEKMKEMKEQSHTLRQQIKEKADKSGLLARMKEGAETMQIKIQAKAESVGFKPINPDGGSRKGSDSGLDGEHSTRKPISLGMAETNITMEVAQLLLSLTHTWGLDPDLDRVCESKLGLLHPMVPVSFGILSKAGYMSLFLPTWQAQYNVTSEQLAKIYQGWNSNISKDLPPEMVQLEERTRLFTSRGHWELSTTVTTNHLLSVTALANTLMSMNNATFVSEQERKRNFFRHLTRLSGSSRRLDGGSREECEDIFAAQQSQIKQGWSFLATLHCVLLPDKVAQVGAIAFKRPQVELLARRWQDRCLEIREASQALLLAELRRLGPKGRKSLVDEWAPFLPTYSDPFPGGTAAGAVVTPQEGTAPRGEIGLHVHQDEDEELEEDEAAEESSIRKPSSYIEAKRKQATSIILLGVIGAEFGQDLELNKKKLPEDQNQKKKVGVEGFGLGNSNLARLTSKALTYLLLAPASSKMPAHTPLRRAAIDLISRGFIVWEPYLDVSRILLGMLELCCEADKLVPSMTYGLPLTPAADSCRTARHALSLIATARPAAVITTMAKEVARYNTLQQNAQTLNVNLSNSVLNRAKPEILRVVELLIDKMQSEIVDLLVEVMDIILHCLDHGKLKTKGLSEVFPPICHLNQVSHCPQTRRIAVGAKNGNLAMYELRASKCQMIPAHATAITACAFSPDGKFLASYSCGENRLSFWQTSTGMFGLGNAQTRCVKTYSTTPIPDIVKMNPMRMARLIWISNKTVTLMLVDGTETRFTV